MSTKTVLQPASGSHNLSKLIQQYGCGSVRFEGTNNALYERHLHFDSSKWWPPTGWFAARPSGTENLYKTYAQSFRDKPHLDAIVGEAKEIVNHAFTR